VEALPLELVGRETEMARLRRILGAVDEGSRDIVLRGGPGIGKTALWRQRLEAAAEAGSRVLVTRCVEVEMPLPLSALVDLLEAPCREVADELPVPQRRALAVALGLEEPPEHPAEPLILARATLEVLRALSGRAPLVVAIDDVQWLDAASQRVSAFDVRRLADAAVVLLATPRTEAGNSDPLALTEAFKPSALTEIELGGLTAGAIQHLVRIRLGVRLPRPLLARVHGTSGGNPMFALELARSLPDPPGSAGAPLPVPDSLQELVRVRVASLPKELIPLVRLVAVLERPTLAQLGRTLASEERAGRLIDVGFAHAVLDVATDGVVRFTHPLLASAVYAEIAPAERRRIQLHAAEFAEDDEERARHLALATSEPDAAVAITLDAAAKRAAGRGAPEAAAAELALHALRLTALDDVDRVQRGLAYATYLIAANRPGPRGAAVPREAARELDDLLAREVAGDERARVLMLRSLLDLENVVCVKRLREPCAHAEDTIVRARAWTMLAWTLGIWGWKLEEGAQEAERAVEIAVSAKGTLPLVFALTARGAIDDHRGKPGGARSARARARPTSRCGIGRGRCRACARQSLLGARRLRARSGALRRKSRTRSSRWRGRLPDVDASLFRGTRAPLRPLGSRRPRARCRSRRRDRPLAGQSRLPTGTPRRSPWRGGTGRERRCGSSCVWSGERRPLARRRGCVGARIASAPAGRARDRA